MRISPGAAACWRRAATFTASPVAKVESRLVDDHLARLDADARLETELADVIEDPRARPGRRGRRRPRARCGIPKAAITASPANFSTVPPCVSMQRWTPSKKLVTRRRVISGSWP